MMPQAASIAYVDPDTGRRLEVCKAGFRNPDSGKLFPAVREIPRFVSGDNYTANFGDQWNAFRNTQLDQSTRLALTRNRFFRGTEWSPQELQGRRVLELGCGAGRFTEVLLSCGAEVWAVDASVAVDACYANWGGNPMLHLSQADLQRLPFLPASFDYVFMYGVMQHTPSPRRALEIAVSMARVGGRIAVDSYRTMKACRWTSKYLWRWLTTRLPPRVLRRFVSWYIPRWIRIDDVLGRRLPPLQRSLACVIPCWNYRGLLPLSEAQRVEWAILDTYDALGARYDRPCSRQELAAWLNSMRGIEFSIKPGGNGLEASIRKIAEA
jgi:SAM-dependent methyltransferase